MVVARRMRWLLLAGLTTVAALAFSACVVVGTYLDVDDLVWERASWLTVLRGHAWLSGTGCQAGTMHCSAVTVPVIARWQDPGPDRGVIASLLAHGSPVRVLGRRYVPEQRAYLYMVASGDGATGWVHEQFLRNLQPGGAFPP